MADMKVGDTVRLKSGGPLMTVHSVGSFADSGGPEQGVLCVWFDGKHVPMERVFDVKTVSLENED